MKYFDKQVMSLWAKKEERESRFYWLPLIVHLSCSRASGGDPQNWACVAPPTALFPREWE